MSQSVPLDRHDQLPKGNNVGQKLFDPHRVQQKHLEDSLRKGAKAKGSIRKKTQEIKMRAASPAVAFNAKKYGALFAHGVAHTITTDAENRAAIKELEVYSLAENPTPEEEAYCEVLATLIEQYEKRYRLNITLNPIETLKLLIENRGLKQADLVPEIDSKSHVSEILNGTRELSKGHIMKLSNFFSVSPEVFFPITAAQ